MKYAAVILAAAVGVQAQAWKRSANVTVTTEVVDEYVTYCPGPTQVTHGDKVYTVTAPTTLTITDCPCTITKPVTQPTVPAASGTGIAPTKSGPSVVPTAAAGKNAALTGAGLAGIVGFAAFVL